ncbi:hypothetical protein [Methermicoccus shengliensis]|nr:hypothetical protein [Methermicoccus shengliensis]
MGARAQNGGQAHSARIPVIVHHIEGRIYALGVWWSLERASNSHG